MIQTQPNEKLHAACDECRTRKLKCSGDRPSCTRCQREKLACVFSPQKQMGRPKKRRREVEANESADSQRNASNGPITLNDSSAFGNSGLVTPPQSQDLNCFVPDIVHTNPTPSQHQLQGSDAFSISPILNIDLHREPPIDPSLWDNAISALQVVDPPDQGTMTPCTCLASMYLTLSDLQSVQTFHFPQVVIPLRKAMGVLSDLIHCPQCPKDNFSAIQNIASIASLCKAIVERFNKVLMGIDAEAERLEQTGGKKPYRIGDNNPNLYHLHTGTLDCPMGFNIEIGAQEFKRIAKAALKTEVYGNGSNPRPLLQLIKEAEDRQKRWHEDVETHCAEREHLFGKRTPEDAKNSCQALGSDHIRRMINHLKWE